MDKTLSKKLKLAMEDFRLPPGAMTMFEKKTGIKMAELEGVLKGEKETEYSTFEIMTLLIFAGISRRNKDLNLSYADFEEFLDEEAMNLADEEDINDIDAFMKVIQPCIDKIDKSGANKLPSK